MKNLILVVLLFVVIPVWPSVAGCGGGNDTYYKDANTGTIWIYSGVTTIPQPSDPNKVVMDIDLFPSQYFKARNTGERITMTQWAAECNKMPSQMRVVVPPDCNYVPITSLGDPNTFYMYRIAIDYAKAPLGTYKGVVRIMDSYTAELDVTIVINKKQVLFFVEPCN